jgi:2-keto-3-deoxy-L-rhamnonate aldolase RhmA
MFDLGFNFTAVGNDVSILSGVLTNLAAHFRKQ